MPGKSRHRRGKHSFQSKKGRGRPSPPVIVTPQQATIPADESVSPPEVSRKSVPATPTAVQYPYVLTELRRIGILAGIMVAILIILALVLS